MEMYDDGNMLTGKLKIGLADHETDPYIIVTRGEIELAKIMMHYRLETPVVIFDKECPCLIAETVQLISAIVTDFDEAIKITRKNIKEKESENQDA